MLLFNREVQTVGNPEQIMPLVQSFVNIANEAGVTLNVWSGSNGYVPGTLSFSGVYESVSEMSAGSAKINASKKWWETISKFREYVVTTKPDSVYNYVRGGAKGVVVPNGTIVQQNTFQMSSGSNFIETLTWMNELIDASMKITGLDSQICHSLYGTLGEVGYLTFFAHAEQIDEVRAKVMANAEWLPKFLEGGKFSTSGTVMQRHMVKIA